MLKHLTSAILCAALATASARALDPEPGAVFARVIDVGAGLACVVKIPGSGGDDHYLIYDAGHWNTDRDVLEAVQEIVPEDEAIDLMVLSHSDSDHLGAVDELCDAYQVKRVIRTGMQRTTGTWRDANDAIKLEKQLDGCIDINLQYFEFPPGGTYRFGEAFVTFVCGFGEPREDWDIDNQSEERNSVSVVIRLQYKGKSILFCGDAVGRHNGDPDTEACIATEKFMVDMAPVITIDSDVLIAPHHGADNGSSMPFIRAVSPDFVIFSAGHAHDHPRAMAAQRYLSFGVPINHIFRTDLGDDESDDGDKEWGEGRISGHRDVDGDDAVDVLIRENGSVAVGYR